MKNSAQFWFHESVCDTASLFTVRQMAFSWSRIFLADWAWFSIAIQDYARKLMTQIGSSAAEKVDFPDWFRINQKSLRASWYQRERNLLVARQILPVFENHPAYWDALRFIPDCDGLFETFLHNWNDQCSCELKPLITELASIFGVNPT
jgi:hypothetical protein